MSAPTPDLPPTAPAARAPDRPLRLHGVQPGLVVAWLLAAVALTVSVLLWQKVLRMQELLARQSTEAGTRSVEARTLAHQAEETARALSSKVATLDSKVADIMDYRAQLDTLVQSVARTRDENLAVELEATLRLAQDQSRLTGSAEPLLAALRTAEQRLAHASDPRLAPVARAVARDLERVKATSLPDIAGLLARIDQLLRQVDDLPAANSVGQDSARATAAQGEPDDAATTDDPRWWTRAWRHVWAQAQSLLRVSRVERPEASMLSPEQVFFVRENLKLRLQGARLALLARQYEAARSDLAAATSLIGTWFDPASRRTQAAATLLQQLQAASQTADLPRADHTLAALGQALAAAEAQR